MVFRSKNNRQALHQNHGFFKKINWSGSIMATLRLILIIGISFVILLPIFIKISSSFMTRTDLIDKTVQWVPRQLTLYNYRIVWQFMEYPRTLLNSIILTTLVSITQLASCTAIAYGFARFSFKGKNLFFGLVILTLVVPPQIIMIPLYLNFRNFSFFGLLNNPINLLGSYWPFILTAITGTGLRNGLYIFILRQFFKGMPKSLEEAAYVDGAGLFKTFYRVMLPGAVPALVIVFLFSFVWQWNDDIFLTLYLSKSAQFLPQTLQDIAHVILNNLEGDIPAEMAAQYGSLFQNAGTVLFIAPLLLLYAFMQKYFIESIQRTGLVG